MSFTPNATTYTQGIAALEAACKKYNLDINAQITTSQNEIVKKVLSELEVTNIPDGFVKFQLPVHFKNPTQTYMSFGAPRTKVPLHSHDEGPGIRVIMTGSISYNGCTLTAGDWMYIPAGQQYEFEVGDMGVAAFYCYECSCRQD